MANILVVDDTPENLHLLIKILGEQGYDIRVASSGTLALKSVRVVQPELILLDVKMPGMDGYTVCEQLKADDRTRNIPVIFISALSELQDKVKGFAVGGVDYISKPFQAEEVLARVDTHLTLRQLQQHLQEEVHKRRVVEKELRELNTQLQEANRSKDKFFSIIAHDLRSPFSGLITLTELLSKEFESYSSEEIKTMMSRLHKSSEKVYALLTNLLEWSRLQRGLIQYEPMPCSPSDIVDGNLLLFAAVAERKQIVLRNCVSQDAVVCADYNMLETILRNLLSNALKFTEAGGEIIVSSKEYDESLLEISVSDTGIGMDPAVLAGLFRIDVKSSRSGTDGELGSGLGLLLCKELIEKSGGRIWGQSEKGKGSTFSVVLQKVCEEDV